MNRSVSELPTHESLWKEANAKTKFIPLEVYRINIKIIKENNITSKNLLSANATYTIIGNTFASSDKDKLPNQYTIKTVTTIRKS